MSIWEFRCVAAGYDQANGGGESDEPQAPSEEEYRLAVEQYG